MVFRNSLVAAVGVVTGLALLAGLAIGAIAAYEHVTADDPKVGLEITVHHPEGQLMGWEDRERCWLASKARLTVQAMDDDLVLLSAVQPKVSRWPDLSGLPLLLSPEEKKKLAPCPREFQAVAEEWRVSYVIGRQKKAKAKQQQIERLKRRARKAARPLPPEREGGSR